ncbi:MAG: hypothetical protein NW241_10195 [Bacteroidia bacterium]|nr:hypothetical protein [Bacteroidia bacterium]
MIRTAFRTCLPGALAGLLLLSGCRFDPDGLSWKTDLLAPIAYATVTPMDFIPDTSLVQTGPDGVLRILFRDTLNSATLSEIGTLPDTATTIAVRLNTLVLSSDTVTQSITLADLARQLQAQGNIFGAIILANHGGTLPIVPATPGLSSGAIPVDGSAFFNFADLEAGELVLSIANNFPLDLQNVIFEIRNAQLPGPPIVSDTFAVIPKNTSVTESYDLAGKQVESQLIGELKNLDLQGGFLVPIDTTDDIVVQLQARDLIARTATAIFPAQTILDTIRRTSYRFGSDFSEVQLTRLNIKAGRIRAQAVSTVQDSILFEYELPGAVNAAGSSPKIRFKLPPAPPGGTASLEREVSLAGYSVDLTAGGATFNTLEEAIRASLVFSGNLVTLNQSDSVVVNFALEGVEPSYVEGNFGQDVFTVSGTEALEVFEDLPPIVFERAAIRLLIEHRAGIPAQVEILELTAIDGAESLPLSGTPLLAGPILLPAVALPDTNGAVYRTLTLDRQNSNVLQVLNLPPRQVRYRARLTTNPGARQLPYGNFLTDQSRISAYLEAEVPLEGRSAPYTRTDTIALSPDPSLDLDRLGSGTLRLLIENRFPIACTALDAVFVEANGAEIARFAADAPIPAGIPDAQGVVQAPALATLEASFDGDTLRRILQRGSRLRVTYVLETPATPVKLLSSATLTARLIGQFEYEAGN